jgi:hypothetical protein
MRAQMPLRVERLAERILTGCPVCREWPDVWLLGDDDSDPPEVCPECGVA